MYSKNILFLDSRGKEKSKIDAKRRKDGELKVP